MTPAERDALVNLLDECGRLVALRLEHYRSSGFVGDSPLLNRINAAIAALTAQPSAAEPVAIVKSEYVEYNGDHSWVEWIGKPPYKGTKLYTHPPSESSPESVVVPRNGDAMGHLRELVTALENSFISSWQTTAGWQKQLDAASEFLAAAPDAQKAKL